MPSSSTPARALALLAREPLPGQVKTRLARAIGDSTACELYRAFVLDRLKTHSEAHQDATIYLAHTPDSAPVLAQWVASTRVHLLPQVGKDLSQRMEHLVRQLWKRGHRKLVLTNTDSPHLGPELVDEAWRLLEAPEDAVLLPDLGGGYALLGLAQPCPGLFAAADGSANSFERTRTALLGSHRKLHLLPPILDVDDLEDLLALQELLQDLPPSALPKTREALLNAKNKLAAAFE